MRNQTVDEDTTWQRQFHWGYPPPGRPHGAEMSPKFEQIGCATLYVGDAREILPMLGDKAAVVVTDPVWPNCPKGMIPGSEDPWALWSETMRHLPEAVHRLVVILRTDSDPRFLAAVPERLKFFRNIQLSYARPFFRNRILGSDEYAYWYGSVVARSDRRIVIPGRGPTAQPTQRRPGDHPCARAQVHLDWLIDRATDVGDIVIDPFSGSGTTGAACVRLGRRYIGIEIEPRFHTLACRRIEAAMRQGDLFVPPALHRLRESPRALG